MSTRASIIIKREGETVAQLYHHFDGYELGVWKTLHTVFNKYDETKRIGYKDLIPLLYKLEILQEGRELEPKERNHSDIEYLYFVDLETSKITYYKGNKDELEASWIYEDYGEETYKHLKELNGDLLEELELKQRERVKHYKETGKRTYI